MARISVTLTSIDCAATSGGTDQIFVVYQADAGLPFRYPTNRFDHQPISADGKWNLNLNMAFERDLQVTIYEDDLTKADYLVSVGYTNLQIPPSVNRTNENGANYTLNMVVNA